MIAGASNASAALRTSVLPIEHLDAELLAAPFASDSAFAAALVKLDPRLDPKRPQATVPLWRQTERDLLCRFPGMSVDELVYRRDRAWFAEPSRYPRAVPLGEVLKRAAADLLDPGAGLARPRVTADRCEADHRRVWRWLTFSLPADLLLAAADKRSDRLDELVSARLRAQLALGGLAEPHLHLKAAMDFPTLWASLMRALAQPGVKADMLQSAGAEWDEGRGLAPLLLSCALARLLLAEFLAGPASYRALGFRGFLNHHAVPKIGRRFGAYTSLPLWRAVYALAAGRVEKPACFPRLRNLYAQLIGPGDPQPPIAKLDPLGYWFPASPASRPDFRLTRAALGYLGEAGADDALFARIFWQTVRGRVLFYRHVVQRPMVPGLQWFTRAYARLSAPRKSIPLAAFVRQAAELGGPGLRALEVRVTPESRLHELAALVETVDQAGQPASGPPAPELGLVFHFSRSRGPQAEAGQPAAWSRGGHDDPAASKHNPSGYRFSGYYRKERKGAMALANLLTAYPRMLERVRGVDLCTDELAVPLWVLRPLVEHVTQAASRAAAHLQASEGQGPGTLAVTVHAGEDFVHLLGGIRRVAEAVELLRLGEGSRIGHAVALGVDVRAWAARAGRIALPKGERLLDLLWAWRVARRVPEDLRSWLPWIDQELVRLGAELFGSAPTVGMFDQWWTLLHSSDGLRAVGFPDGPRPRALGNAGLCPQNWVYRWLTDRALFQRAQALESVDVSREIPLVIALQAHVRQVIGSRGIAVEINPSSNLLIGHLGDLTSHPLWRLCPPAGVSNDAPGVRVCIGSDDPITFATSLPEEYQLLADTLAGAGVAGPDVDAWLEAARQCGLANRFTVPRSGLSLTSPLCSEMPPLPL